MVLGLGGASSPSAPGAVGFVSTTSELNNANYVVAPDQQEDEYREELIERVTVCRAQLEERELYLATVTDQVENTRNNLNRTYDIARRQMLGYGGSGGVGGGSFFGGADGSSAASSTSAGGSSTGGPSSAGSRRGPSVQSVGSRTGSHSRGGSSLGQIVEEADDEENAELEAEAADLCTQFDALERESRLLLADNLQALKKIHEKIIAKSQRTPLSDVSGGVTETES
ncbi:unnamed protein product [Amoebophrya sp. A25]|nr:unnamed protein product [Amoebophrya sp. A25]|eukprot:GSA25T00003299001.1